MKASVVYIGLDVHKDSIVMALARELAGFIWAVGQEEKLLAAA